MIINISKLPFVYAFTIKGDKQPHLSAKALIASQEASAVYLSLGQFLKTCPLMQPIMNPETMLHTFSPGAAAFTIASKPAFLPATSFSQ